MERPTPLSSVAPLFFWFAGGHRDESGKMKRKVIAVVFLAASMFGAAEAENPVFFTDVNVREAVEDIVGLDPTPSRMLDLTCFQS